MESVATRALPDPAVCEQARLSRDPRFDGLFFTAVRSTGIYCRPMCPAPSPKRENVVYYAEAAAAAAAGFRPCLRCRPELAPGASGWRRGDDALARALRLIDAGEVEDEGIAALAERVHLSARQLQRLFVQRLGAAPLAVLTTRRLLFAKRLLVDTDLPVTEIALAAGFGSLRRFNAAFKDAFDRPPSEIRRRPRAVAGKPLTLTLGYRPPYDFAGICDFLSRRAIPGLDQIVDGAYERLVASGDGAGWLRVSDLPGESALKLEVHGIGAGQLQDTVRRVRRLFDLDAEPGAIHAVFANDPVLGDAVRRWPGLRVPGGWDGFEVAVRAVLGQQVSVAAARTLAGRLVRTWGRRCALDAPAGLDTLFPSPEVIAEAELTSIGVTSARARTLNGIAAALAAQRIDFRTDRSLDEFVDAWVELPGIGDWTAQYIALRALSHPDAFPAGDLILRRAASGGRAPLSDNALRARAEAWRPWRAYATLYLWRLSSEIPTQ